MSLDSRKLRYFVAVYEEGSVTRAAERESIVQPALSVHLRQLEEELGQRLFERSAQGMHPTPAAHEFYGHATDLLRRMREIRQRMLDGGGRLSGPLRVGLMPSVCRGLLDVIRDGFVERYPGVDLTLLEATSGSLAEAVTSGRLDLAVANSPASATALRLRLLRRDPVTLVAGTGTRFRGEALRLTELADVQLALPSRANAIRRLLEARLKSAEVAPARFVEIDGLDATMRFVAGSAWCTVVPGVAVVHDRGSPQHVLCPLTDPDLTSDIYAMHAAERPLSLPAQSFVDAVHAALEGAPGITAPA